MKDRFKGYLKKLTAILKKPEMGILPANIAFNIILAIIPLLTIVVLIASYFNISIDLVANLISEIMPKQVSNTLVEVISGKGFDTRVGIFTVVAFFIASNGMYAVINTSDTLYEIRESDVIKKRVSSIILLFIIIILFVFLLVVPLFGENILNLMESARLLSKYSRQVLFIFNIIKWPLTILIIYLNIKLIYTIAPSKNIRSEETTYGAVFTTVGWIMATLIFKFYLNRFARYDIIYGNLSSLIMMMVWVNLVSYIFVLGMAINASRRKEREILEETMRIEREKIEEELKKQEKKKKKKKRKKETEVVTEEEDKRESN